MRSFTMAIVECRGCPEASGLHDDPFLPDFRLEDLARSADARLARLEGLVERAASAGAELVLLSEDITHLGLAATFLEKPAIFRAMADRQAETVPARLRALAGRLGIHLAGSFFASEGKPIRNVAELFGPDGRSIGRYRKVHLPAYEAWMVTAGSSFPVFETELGRLGMLICYDQNWPEAFGALALGGAEMVLHPSAATLREYRMVCRTVDHHIFYASACPRGSMIVAPTETVVARSKGKSPEIIAGRIDGSLLQFGDEGYYDAMYSGIRDHRSRELRERRPETYGVLVEREPPVYASARVPTMPAGSQQVADIYARHRTAHLAAVRGQDEPYHWEYWRGAREPPVAQ